MDAGQADMDVGWAERSWDGMKWRRGRLKWKQDELRCSVAN